MGRSCHHLNLFANGTYPLRTRNVLVTQAPLSVGCVELGPEELQVYKNEDFTQLMIRRKPGGRYVWLKCLKATAVLYGWDKAFPTLIEAKSDDSPNGYVSGTGRRGFANGGGIEHRISRSPKTTGWPAGQTNTFRLSKDANFQDLAEVAKATQADWQWITCKHGGRRKREDFLSAALT